MKIIILLTALLFVLNSAAIAASKSMCDERVLEKNTVQGIYLGADCEDMCYAAIRLENGEEFSFICDDVAARKYFGDEPGSFVSVTYEVKQFWNEYASECARTEVCVTGEILRSASGTKANIPGPVNNGLETVHSTSFENIHMLSDALANVTSKEEYFHIFDNIDEFINKFIQSSDIMSVNYLNYEIGKLSNNSHVVCKNMTSNECDEIRDVIRNLNNKILKTRGNLCNDYSVKICDGMNIQVDEDYKNHLLHVNFSDPKQSLSLYNFVCAAVNANIYKSFGKNFLTDELVLKLKTGSIYFLEFRLDLDSKKTVDNSFKGNNVVNVLLASRFESVDGRVSDVTDPAIQMRILYSKLGGMPKNDECVSN